MVWWVVVKPIAKLLAPFAAGVLGILVRLALVAAIVVVGSYTLLDVNLIEIALQVAASLFDQVVQAAMESATS